LFKAALGFTLLFLLALGLSGCFSPDVPDLPDVNPTGSSDAEQLAEKEAEISELQAELAQKEAELLKLKPENDRRTPTQSGRRIRPGGTPGICDRTPEVQFAIIEALDIASCKLIDADELFRVQRIDSLALRSVQPHDFADLPNLRELNLHVCNPEPLPVGLFDDLGKLERLYLTVRDRRYIPLETLEDLESLSSMESLDVNESRC
jgi:hypothetical protein